MPFRALITAKEVWLSLKSFNSQKVKVLNFTGKKTGERKNEDIQVTYLKYNYLINVPLHIFT